jgi:hypothetical protein
MSVVAIIIKAFAAFRYGQIVIVASGSSDIKKVCPSFSSADAFAVNAVHSFFVIVVRHNRSI